MPFFRCSFLIILPGNTDTVKDRLYVRFSRNAGKRHFLTRNPSGGGGSGGVACKN